MFIKKIIILIFSLILPMVSTYSDNIELLVTRNTRGIYEENNKLLYKNIKIGDIVEIVDENIQPGYMKVTYKEQDLFISSAVVIDHRNLKSVTGLWVTSNSDNTLYYIVYNPLKGSTIAEKGKIDSKTKMALYTSKIFNGEKYIFVYQSKEKSGWIKLDSLEIDTEHYYSKTPDNNLKNSDLIEKKLLSKTKHFVRDGIHLKVPAKDLTLTDDFSNNLHHKRYRAYDVYNNRFLIYSELIDIKFYYHILDLQSDNKLFLTSVPKFNNNNKLAVTDLDFRDNRSIGVMILDYSNSRNIQKELSVAIHIDKPATSVESKWINNETLRIDIKQKKDEIKTISFQLIDNYWVCSDDKVIIEQKL